MIGSVIAVVAGIAGGTYFLEDRYLTDTTGVPRDTVVETYATKDELIAAQAANSTYLLDLRIEQAISRQRDLEDRKYGRQLTDKEQRRLDDTDKELERLYNLKETTR